MAAARAVGVRDERVLDAVAAVPRARFVPLASRGRADVDEPVRITHRQVTTQPSLTARMVEALELGADDKVLEVGTGYGWQTALLARLAREVYSVELWADMVEAAREALAAERIANVHLVVGDGSQGVPEHAPYDALIVCAAFPTVPPPLVEQLAAGGRLVQPIGPSGDEDVTLFRRDAAGLTRVGSVIPAYFVPLYGRHGYPLDQAPAEP